MTKCTLIRLDNNQPFVEDAIVVPNADGSVSFLLSTGQFVGQEPNVYGLRHDGPAPQAYQRATLSGNVVVFVTRPQDKPFVYLFGQGQAYSA